ncbi:uncharacterized protein LOC134251774 [Saccostrea cucullata]|uniref:uncharacterized protein LOC134251774 n=1 Tax=Saccostrea cuccullata TaxID=36930 RepID=UPI002ED0D5A1
MDCRTLSAFVLFMSLVYVKGLSVVTGNDNQTLTSMEELRVDAKNTDVFRQLLNQETLIRISLVKNVHALMKDMVDMKQVIISLQESQKESSSLISDLRTEVASLKEQNKKLNNDIISLKENAGIVQENLTELFEIQRTVDRNMEVKRQTFESNITTVLGDMKTEVRYLSVTLLDLNKHTLEMDKTLTKAIEEKTAKDYEKLNESITNLNADLMTTNGRIMATDDINRTINALRTDVMQSKMENLKLSSAVSSLEVFRMNMTNNHCDLKKKVGFTVGMPSSSSSWSSDVLVFSKVITNSGGGYNANTGIFTAPVAGMYQFFVTVISYGSQDIYLYIAVNGNTKVTAAAEAKSSSTYQTGTNMLLVNLNQGDTVWIKRYTGTGYYSDNTPITTFSGVLL